MNLYAYAGNNPVAFSDPFGLDPCNRDRSGFTCFNQTLNRVGEQLKSALITFAKDALDSQKGPMMFAMMAATGGELGPLGAIEAGAARGSTGFVVNSKGVAVAIPEGARGPLPTHAPGMQYLEGTGGRGLDSKVTGVRIMDANATQPARAVYMNSEGQAVSPKTGRTVAKSDPEYHHYLEK